MSALIEVRRAGVRFRRELQGRGLFVRRDPFWALRSVDLTINDGDRLGVIGTNGAGKTTLMRLLAGVFEPDEGEVVRRIQPTLLSLGAGFNQNLSGRQNIRLNGALLGIGHRRIRALEEEIVAFAELGDFIDAPIRTYSSGMRMRLGFSIASHLRPDILLLDETLATGDRFFREKARVRLFEMAGQCRALVLVAHQEKTIERLCSRALWIERGRIRMQGPVDEVISAYRGGGEDVDE